MKAFVSKYKWNIIYFLTLLAVVVYFAPKQNDYYFDNDIKNYKSKYLIPILFWTCIILCSILFGLLVINMKSIKQSLLSFFFGAILISCNLFIFQDVILGGALFINRLYKRDHLQKAYVVNYLSGLKQTKYNLISYDLETKQFSIDRKLSEQLYRPFLKQNDTIILKLNKGLLGIVYP